MSFLDDVGRARALLEAHGRVSLRGLRRQFDLDDEQIEELVEELVDVMQAARREGNVLVWAAGDAPPAVEPPATVPPPSEDETPTQLLPVASPAPSPSVPEEAASVGERRQLTVLFCDLADSSQLSSSLDPEDWREVIELYQQTAAAQVERFAGHVAEFLGDGILAYFGYPVAHEDDAERAVRAGLAMVNGTDELNAALPSAASSITLRVRVGVHTGPVVLGAMGDDRGDVRALGETTNLAARLQNEAQPDTVVMSPQTRRLVQGVFTTKDRGEHELKGIREPVRVIEVERVTGVRSRLDILAAEDLTPLVGRDQELGLFEDRFGQAEEGFGQAIVLNGEAGIGKSRLVHAFRERLQDRGHSWLECRCSPYAQDSAFHPVLELVRQALRFRPDDPFDTQATALARGLEASAFDLEANLPILTDLFKLPLPADYEPLALEQEGKRIKTLGLLVEWVLRLAQAQPLVLLVEDLHWADPSTLEWLGRILDQIPTSKALLLLTHRPDFESPWPPKSHTTPMHLSRLTRAQLADLVRKAAKARDLPDEWLDQIIRRSDGVPLFAEELTRTVVETNPEVAGAEVPTLHIPETLQDSLMARLDSLGPVKEIVQLASVLGRESDYATLLQVSPLREEGLQAALDTAVREEVFYQRGSPPDATYLFKHSLTRDAAYQSLLRSQRRRHHLHIAETLLERSPTILERQPGRLAYHFAEGGDASRAIPLLQQAARSALQSGAAHEADALLRRAIGLLADTGGADPALELELHDALASASLSTHGFGSEEYGNATSQLASLVDACPEHPMVPWALVKLGSYHRDTGDLGTATALYERAVAVGEARGDSDTVAVGQVYRGLVQGFQGKFREALDLYRAHDDFDPVSERRRIVAHGTSTILTSGAAYGAWWLFAIGLPVQAAERADATLACFDEVQSPLSEATVRSFCGALHVFLGSFERAIDLAETALALARENGLILWQAMSALCRAAASTQMGKPEGGHLPALVRASGQVGLQGGMPAAMWLSALIERGHGDADAALDTIRWTLDTYTAAGQVFWNADFLRLEGEILRDEKNDPPAAEASFRKALDTAHRQQAHGLTLRAATSYAELLRDQGRSSEAEALLTPAYERMSEGHDLADLVAARAVLEDVSR